MAHSFDPSIPEAERQAELSKLEASLVNIVSQASQCYTVILLSPQIHATILNFRKLRIHDRYHLPVFYQIIKR